MLVEISNFPATRSESAFRRYVAAVRDWADRHSLPLLIGALALLVTLSYLAPRMFISIGSGRAGVVWRRFGGTDAKRVFDEGLNVIPPWDVMSVYNLRYQQVTRPLDVLASDGLNIHINVAVRFRVARGTLGILHQNFGPGYVDTLLIPKVGAFVREELALYEPQVFYAEKRLEVQNRVRDKVRLEMPVYPGPNGAPQRLIYVDDVLLLDMRLPAPLQAAIDNKEAERQRALEYEYRLVREKQEAERKVIEARGIRDFGNLVKGSMTDGYLKFKNIEALTALAGSANTKVVVFGGSNGASLVVDHADAAPAPVSAPHGSARSDGPGFSPNERK